jgi:hypothetical protein
MERTCEEATTEEPARRGAWPIGRLGAERGQEARQQRKRAQGRSGQKQQEDARRPAQRPAAAARTPQEKISAAIAAIRTRFEQRAIDLGYLGIRHVGYQADSCNFIR